MRFGEVSALSGIFYTLIGLSGLYQAVFFKSIAIRRTAPGHVIDTVIMPR